MIWYVTVSPLCLVLSFPSKFKDVEGQLLVLSEESRPQQPNDHSQDDGDTFKLLEDLREIIFDYQVRW